MLLLLTGPSIVHEEHGSKYGGKGMYNGVVSSFLYDCNVIFFLSWRKRMEKENVVFP
jgi:hypothetical protein